MNLGRATVSDPERFELISESVDTDSVEVLRSLYAKQLIPPEKKPFLIDLERSSGPLMAVENGNYILDVASQIASMGLGFNAGAMFGAAQFLESWTGRVDTNTMLAVRDAFQQLLARQLHWPDFHLHLCHSGAEANELALGACFEQRINREAKAILAFKQSFHGRTMMALASTWSPQKREPFAWPGHEVLFVDYPELPADEIQAPQIPGGWQVDWSQATRNDFDDQLNVWRTQYGGDEPMQRELDSLSSIRNHLASGKVYAILIEPMQCEGGDRYSSARFHHALLCLARAFDVPLIYDEIQTGFGLGGDFFWHQKFGLVDAAGGPAIPDYVVIAKKAQVGGVISRHPLPFPEQFNATSLLRGYIQASLVDQFETEIFEIESRNREHLIRVVAKYAPALLRPRASGLCFAFDFQQAETLKRFVDQRFTHGLLFYPAGDSSVRFRFNLSYRKSLVDRAWQQIDAALAAVLGHAAPTGSTTIHGKSPCRYFRFHRAFLHRKLRRWRGDNECEIETIQTFIHDAVADVGLSADAFSTVLLDAENYAQFRDRIWQMQTEMYEPLRQTPIEKFDALIQAENHLALLVTEGDQILAMAFAAPPVNFPSERGLKDDPHFDDPNTVYMLDLTVVPQYRGRLGRVMKQAICLLAEQRGLHAVQGRNRDRLARGMWAINVSLGSYCTRILEDDYPDNEKYRDCFMYRCPLQWMPPPLRLSDAVQHPLHNSDLTGEFIDRNLPTLVNKLTLSNFVTRQFLEQLHDVFGLLPASLQHGYSASGISECVDKIVKSVWLRRRPRTWLVTIDGCWFGHATFAARSLSGVGESFFPVKRLARATDQQQLVDDLAKTLCNDDVLAVFVEPLGWQNGEKLSLTRLQAIRDVCQQFQTPLVFHDSAGMFYRYQPEAFLPSAVPSITPDAGMICLGGQMSVAYLSEAYFVDRPLTMISTWDGDAFSLAQFHHSLMDVQRDVSTYLSVKRRYHELLVEQLTQNGVDTSQLDNGVGWFDGPVQLDLASMFHRNPQGRFLSCPNYGEMRQFIQRYDTP